MILHFEYSFCYAFVYKNQFYFDQAIVKPDFVYWLKWWLKIKPYPYKDGELEKIKSSVLTSATNSIDELLKDNK